MKETRQVRVNMCFLIQKIYQHVLRFRPFICTYRQPIRILHKKNIL